MDAGALQDRTHRTTGDDPGTGAGRLEQHYTGGVLTLHRVGNRRSDPGHLEEVLLRLLDALGDRRGHLLGLPVADADGAVPVAHHDQRGEAEPATTLDDLGHAVDGHHPLDVRGLLRYLARASAAVASPAAAFTATLASALGAARYLPRRRGAVDLACLTPLP